MGRFSKINDAKVSKTGQYFKDGHYVVKIGACKVVQSQADPREFFVIETRVIESDNPNIEPGTERSQVIDLSNQMGMPNVKGFIAAASGVEGTSEAVNELVVQEWERRIEVLGLSKQDVITLVDYDPKKKEFDYEIVSEFIVHEDANPLEGLIMKLECETIETKKEKKDFTKHIWGLYEGSYPPGA